MTAKEFLSRAKKLDRQVNLIVDKITLSKENAFVKAVRYDTIRTEKNASDSMIASAVANAVSYESELDEVLKERERVITEIKSVIKEIKEDDLKEFLHRKYLLYQPVSGYYNKLDGGYVRGIADSMEKSERQIYRIQSDALDKVERIINESDEN